MTFFRSLIEPVIPAPDDLTVPQFIFDVNAHPTRPARREETPCFIEEESGRPVYISELRSRTNALAKGIRACWGIGKGDVVALFAPNHVDYTVIAWAVHRLGGIVAAISPSLTTDELVFQLQVAKPTLLVAHIENLAIALRSATAVNLSHSCVLVLDGETAPTKLPFKSVDELIDQHDNFPAITEVTFSPGQGKTTIAFLCFSSGTTGRPKAVAVSHYNVISNIVQSATFNRVKDDYAPWADRRFRPGDVCSGVLPLYHIYGLVVNLHVILYFAMTTVISKKFNYERFLQSIAQFRISHLLIVPPQAVLFCKHPLTKRYDLSSVRFCLIAAAPLSIELTNQLLEVLPDISLGQGYGMTETCAAASMFPVSQKIGTLGSAGQLVSGTVAKVVKADGSLAGVGEPGELFITGPQITLGYYGNDEATRETYIDGWLRTGDEVLFHENGDIFVVDRIKELIKVKGFQVAPSELEGHLIGHPDVVDVAVVGAPDDYSGEVPLAYVVLKPDTAKAIQGNTSLAADVRTSIFKHVADVKSKYKWLAGGVEFIDAIPKNPSGKILRRVLKERSKSRHAPPDARL